MHLPRPLQRRAVCRPACSRCSSRRACIVVAEAWGRPMKIARFACKQLLARSVTKISMLCPQKQFDFIVIGCGSGVTAAGGAARVLIAHTQPEECVSVRLTSEHSSHEGAPAPELPCHKILSLFFSVYRYRWQSSGKRGIYRSEKSDFALGQSPEAFALMQIAPFHLRFRIFENCFAVKSWYQLSFTGTCRAPKSLYKSYGTKCQ